MSHDDESNSSGKESTEESSNNESDCEELVPKKSNEDAMPVDSVSSVGVLCLSSVPDFDLIPHHSAFLFIAGQPRPGSS